MKGRTPFRLFGLLFLVAVWCCLPGILSPNREEIPWELDRAQRLLQFDAGAEEAYQYRVPDPIQLDALSSPNTFESMQDSPHEIIPSDSNSDDAVAASPPNSGAGGDLGQARFEIDVTAANPASRMSQEEVDRIWNEWRKDSREAEWFAQFRPRDDRRVSNLKGLGGYFDPAPAEWVLNTRIPRQIHQTYKTANRFDIDAARLSYMDTWISMNSDVDYKIWTDEEMHSFVDEHYPEDVRKAFHKLSMIVLKTDFFRYLLINKKGGYYTDSDTRCVRHIDWWRIDHENDPVEFIAGLEWYLAPPDFPDFPISITNWAFASVPNHPILKLLIRRITQLVHETSPEDLQDIKRVVFLTGPMQFTTTIRQYMEESGQRLEDLTKGESVFYPQGGVLLLPPVSINPAWFYEPNILVRDERTVLYHEFMGKQGWKIGQS
ncbi:nucleotide-diphospho-sugar transferase [Chytriomyces sp. MP71]|nr:nucleotide-diphospho-sugar transferase [Chytriomyces sp. MP71]